MRLFITDGVIVTPHTTLYDHTLIIEDGKIAAIESGKPAAAPDRTIRANGMWIVPGFIDIHVHGSDGVDTMDATPDAIHKMARFFAKHGVTSYLPTTMTEPSDAIWTALENVIHTPQPDDGAQHLGVHLEGPFLNGEYRGAQDIRHFRTATPEEYKKWFDTGAVRLMTAAPELPGAEGLFEYGLSKGVEFAAGHTAASYEQVIQAANRGVRQATHTFNAMLGLHHRNPGTLGAALTDDRIYAQIIVDGIHVHRAMVKLLVRAKGTHRTILITDAMQAAGLPDGDYKLGGQAVVVKDGIAKIGNTLAGSTVTYDALLRNVMRFTGLSLPEALPMATSTPAEAMGWQGRKGVLAPGADADVVLLDAQLQVCTTIVGGRVVYQA